jgi:uncharacterized protein (TIGR03435 family)
VLLAYGLKDFQLTVPGWMNNSLRFEIQANMPAGAARDDVPEMLRVLLTERFGLVARIETRAVDGSELVVGSDGIKMREAESLDELTKDFGGDAASAATDRVTETLDGPVRMMMIPLGMRRVTARTLYNTWTTERLTFQVDAARMTMGEFTEVLWTNVDRPVIDKTGLTGVYAFQVELDPNASTVRGLMSRGITTTVQGNPINQPTGVSTFRAVEGLGLRLQEAQVPLQFVVVEKMSQTPTDN